MKATVTIDIPAGKYCDDCRYAHVEDWLTKFPKKKATCLLLGTDLGYIRYPDEGDAHIMRDIGCPGTRVSYP